MLEDVRAEHHVEASVHRRIEVIHTDRERRRATRCWTGLQGRHRGIDRLLEQAHVLEAGTCGLDGDHIVPISTEARRDRPDAAPDLEDPSRARSIEQRGEEVEGDRDLVEVRVELLEEVRAVGGEASELRRCDPLQLAQELDRGRTVARLIHLRA